MALLLFGIANFDAGGDSGANPKMKMNGSRKHIELLDYIRAVAIVLVLFFHTLGCTFGNEELPWHGWIRGFSVPASYLWLFPFSFGQVGVAIFFVVSGFCIHLSFQQQGQEWRSFWIRRFWRIYPAYIAATAFAVVFLATNSRLDLHSSPIWVQVAAHAFLVHNLNQATFAGINGSFWSLAVEAQLYLLYPLLLMMVGRFGWRRTMIMLACCEFFIRGMDGFVQTTGTGNTVLGYISWLFSASPLGYWFSWALGAQLAQSYLKNEPMPFARIPLVPLLVVTVLSYFTRPTLSFLFVLTAIATAIVASRLLGRVKFEIRAPGFFLNVLGKIGLWSYSIYLLHQPLLNAISVFLTTVIPGPYRTGVAPFFYFVAGWLIIIPVSALWYQVFELPGIAVGRRMIQKRALAPEARTGNEPLQKPFSQRLRTSSTAEQRSQVYGLNKSFYVAAVALAITAAGILFGTRQLDEWNAKNELKLAETLEAKHKYGAALQHYHLTLERDANCVEALNNAAWLLATAPNPRLRNGKMAMDLARRACELTDYKQTLCIGTLAAACAEAGRYDEAVANAQRAQAMALSSGLIEIATRDRQMLELYQAGKSFHQSPGPD